MRVAARQLTSAPRRPRSPVASSSGACSIRHRACSSWRVLRRRGGSGSAVAAGSGGAWASHRASAALRELDGFPPRQVEVLMPCTAAAASAATGSCTRAGTLRGADVDEVDGIPCTTVARTLLDLPATSHPFLVGLGAGRHASRRWPGTLEEVVARHLRADAARSPRHPAMPDRLLEERLGTGPLRRQRVRDERPSRLVRSGRAARPGAAARRPRRRLRRLPRPGVAGGACGRSSATASPTTRASAPHEWDRPRRRRLKRPRLGRRRGDVRPGHPRRAGDRRRRSASWPTWRRSFG